jgi:tagatose-1,6-bisphosphate aldolase
MLSRQEREDLVVVVDILFNDSRLHSLKNSFNENTADVVEQAMEELVKCNTSMKELVAGLVAGTTVFARGWLRKSLDKIAQALRDKQLQFDGMACRNQVAANFRQEIYLSTF